MEPEGSLPPPTGPYPDPVESSPHLYILFKIRFNIIATFTHSFLRGLFASGFPTKIWYALRFEVVTRVKIQVEVF